MAQDLSHYCKEVQLVKDREVVGKQEEEQGIQAETTDEPLEDSSSLESL